LAFIVEGVSRHGEPQSQVRRIGEYRTLPEAIAAATAVVETFLRAEFRPGMDAQALFARYQAAGEYPFIFRDDDKTVNVPGFSHAQCAMTLAREICGGK
jgi:hypothetical protein